MRGKCVQHVFKICSNDSKLCVEKVCRCVENVCTCDMWREGQTTCGERDRPHVERGTDHMSRDRPHVTGQTTCHAHMHGIAKLGYAQMSKETYEKAKETYEKAKETCYQAKETY